MDNITKAENIFGSMKFWMFQSDSNVIAFLVAEHLSKADDCMIVLYAKIEISHWYSAI